MPYEFNWDLLNPYYNQPYKQLKPKSYQDLEALFDDFNYEIMWDLSPSDLRLIKHHAEDGLSKNQIIQQLLRKHGFLS